MSKWRSAGIIVLASVCGAAYTGERPRGQEPPHAVEQPSPAAVLTSQLCRIDIKGEKKDQWMRLPKPESSVTELPIDPIKPNGNQIAVAAHYFVRGFPAGVRAATDHVPASQDEM
jgi:hypothetical protein